jgi:hypothetical protein
MESKASCNCGAVTLTFKYTDATELRSILCHCVNCAKSSGSGTYDSALPGGKGQHIACDASFIV